MKKTQSGSNFKSRPPIVTILGHVDHGKTTLLDKIRKTNVAGKEAGGITQSIGASVITTQEGKKITFIDTPGHAAFSKMRSRGAKLADMAILVVAAHGSIKPQTKEAIKFIKEADIPYIVAATKIDLPSASVDVVSEQLIKEGVDLEDQGGSVALVPVSGKTGEGVNELLEMISLVCEMNEIRADFKGELEAVVIETDKDRRGLLASVVLRNGTLSVGDEIVVEGVTAKVKGLFDSQGKSVKVVLPGEPAQVLGFSELPPVGSIVSHRKGKNLSGQMKKKSTQQKVKEGQIPIVLKAGSSGSLEAVIANLPPDIVVISSGVGDVIARDVFLAKSAKGVGRVFAFEAKTSSSVKKLAVTEGVEIEMFKIIYKLFDRADELISKDKEQVLGKAIIVDSFPFDKKRVAGSKVTEGRIAKNDELTLVRGEKELGQVKVISIRKGKQEVDIVKPGEECGILFVPQLEFEPSDMLLSKR